MGLKIGHQSSIKFRVTSTLIAVFALVAQPFYGLVASEVASAAAGTVTNVDASYVKTSGYTGIYVGFDVENANTATAVEVRANRSNGTTYSMTAGQSVVDGIRAASTVFSTGGTLVVTGSRSSNSWIQQGTWIGSSEPVSVDVTVILEDGTRITGTDDAMRDNGASAIDVLPVDPVISAVDASYVKTSGYTGIYVGFDAKNINTATALEVRTNRSDNTSYSMFASPSLLATINANAASGTFSTGGTLIVTGSRTSSSWTPQVGTWNGSSTPVSVDVIVTLQNGNTVFGSDSTIRDNGATQAEVMPTPAPNTSPTVTFVNPTPGESTYVNGSIIPRVIATDDYGMSSYFIRVWKGAFESGVSNLVYNGCYSAPGAFLLGTSQDVTCPMLDTRTLVDGKYVLSAQFLDGNGQWGASLRTINIDNTRPKIAVKTSTGVADGTIGSNPYSRISFSLNDPKGGLKEVVLNNNSYTRTAEWSDLNWQNITKSHLIEGVNEIYTVDRAGNKSDVLNFIYDKTAPTVTIKSSPDTLGSGPYKKVSFKLSDLGKIDKAEINGLTIPLSDNAVSDLNNIAVGSMNGKLGGNIVKVYDVAGNVKEVSFVLDNKAPQGSLRYGNTNPINGNVIAYLTINDNESIATPAGWTPVGGSASSFSKKYTRNTSEVISFTDLAGNVGTVDLSITWIDKTNPVAPVLNNSPVYVNASEPSDQATWVHDGTDVQRFEYREYMTLEAANADANGNTASYWIQTKTAEERSQTVGQSWTGEYTLYYRVVAIDAAGNRSTPSELGRVIIDKSIPTGELTQASLNNGASSVLTLATSEEVLDIAGWSRIDATTFTREVFSNGDVSVSFTDLAGNTGSKVISVNTVDVNAPDITILSITPNSDGTYTIVGSSDDDAPVSIVLMSGAIIVSSLVTQPIQGQWTAVTAILQPGTYKAVASSKDAADNESQENEESSRAFIVPVVFVPSPVDALLTPQGVAPQLNISATGNQAATILNEAAEGEEATTDASILGAQTAKEPTKTLAVQATEKGWEIFGLAWYWWLLILAALAAGIWWLIAAQRRRSTDEA